MKKLIFYLFLALSVPMAYAQTPVKVAEEVATVAKTVTLPAIPAEVTAAFAAAEKARFAALANLTPTQRFMTNHQRTIVGMQTSLGVSVRKAVENTRSLGAVYVPRHKLPPSLEGYDATVPAFTNLTVKPELAPILPLTYNPEIMYRGLGLPADGKAIRNILQNGLRLEDVGSDSCNLLLSMACSDRNVGALRQMSQVKYTNLTNDPFFAFQYASRNTNGNNVPVIISVRGLPQDKILRVDYDIPADQIDEVLALVNWNGVPTWCRVTLAEDAFKLTPYLSVTPKDVTP